MASPTNNNFIFPQTGSFSTTPQNSTDVSPGSSSASSPSFSSPPDLSGLYYGKIVCLTTWLDSIREIEKVVDLKERKLKEIKARFGAYPDLFKNYQNEIQKIEDDIRLGKNTIEWAQKRAYTHLQPEAPLKPKRERFNPFRNKEAGLALMDCDDSNPPIGRKRKENLTPDLSQDISSKKRKIGNPTVRPDLIAKLYKIGHRIYFKKEYGIILGFDVNRSQFTVLLDNEKEPRKVGLNDRHFYFIPQTANEQILVKFKKIRDTYFPARVLETKIGPDHITHTLEFDCKPNPYSFDSKAVYKIDFRNIYTLMPAPTDDKIFSKAERLAPLDLDQEIRRTFFAYKLSKRN